ncbi:uncharacterized protein LOC128861335 isoform X1 [Anastrepha ludens]|uniref:uncharacterized protein LOC128861335 isoform X1 n=1 Tax=Anastrepha ludens TaxID=28586 RepID=UPI0023AE705A|nr:uncharacterized protein LOC128861335 isoform X1 [Anastrepha ludens]
MYFIKYFVGMVLIHTQFTYARLNHIQIGANLTEFMQLQRQRRSLIFNGNGLVKIDAGVIASINLDDPVDWRSIVSINNIQGGFYPLPYEPLYPWDKWEDIFARSLKNLLPGSNYETDDSRKFAYAAIEALMQLQHGNGHKCLLRSICKNAQVDEHVGIFSEIMDVVLSPGREDIDVVYMEAFQAGKSGADCLRLYAECRVSSNFLDQYLDYV